MSPLVPTALLSSASFFKRSVSSSDQAPTELEALFVDTEGVGVGVGATVAVVATG
jgi:hypothetical protein